MKRLAKHLLRRGQTGQAIVILALGFIVLLGFVGIVTDVSLLFVRYSTLRRAVDSAAVAAAGQMRRGIPTPEEVAKADASGGVLNADALAYARNVATVNLAARQFIELYGLSPSDVIVETCLTTNYSDAALCTDDQRKLVRVRAQLVSPTVFLRLFGWGNVMLEATAISETAVLDVVLIMDVSESMAYGTTPDDWNAVLQPDGTKKDWSGRIIPPHMKKALDDGAITYEIMRTLTNNQLLAYPGFSYQPSVFKAYRMQGGSIKNGGIPVAVPTNAAFAQDYLPRKTCQIRVTNNVRSIPNTDENPLLTEMNAFIGGTGFVGTSWSYFRPAYDYFGCCNDPNSDGDFSDLVCQPFKGVRDASLEFINQIDFARGDRAAIVTYDRSAHLMHPVGGPADDPPMMDAQADVVNTMNRSVGVRAEPDYYWDYQNDGWWDAFVSTYPGGPSPLNPVQASQALVGFPAQYDSTHSSETEQNDGYDGNFDTAVFGETINFPVSENCHYITGADVVKNSVYSGAGLRDPSPLTNIMHPGVDPDGPDYDSRWAGLIKGWAPRSSYELRASCAGSNVGGALRVGSSALLDKKTVRLNGTVWVMVLLSSGPAGASDPAMRSGGREPIIPLVYNAKGTDVNPPGPVIGEYGAFGVCPYGTPENPTELIKDEVENAPYCLDLKPETRHFCFNPVENVVNTADGPVIYTDLDDADCDATYYDVDDYARDWADYIGLIEPYPGIDRTGAQLPTIFTIAFAQPFNSEDGSTCAYNRRDCLGEELLRYIADVGDNNQVDSDYQQDYRDNHDDDLSLPSIDWGGRSPCENPIPGYSSAADAVKDGKSFDDLIVPKPEGESCGNYFNSPGPQELRRVFDEIAARMFTRLAR